MKVDYTPTSQYIIPEVVVTLTGNIIDNRPQTPRPTLDEIWRLEEMEIRTLEQNES